MIDNTEINAFIREDQEAQQQTGGAAAWAVVAFVVAVVGVASWACGFLSGIHAP